MITEYEEYYEVALAGFYVGSCSVDCGFTFHLMKEKITNMPRFDWKVHSDVNGKDY